MHRETGCDLVVAVPRSPRRCAPVYQALRYNVADIVHISVPRADCALVTLVLDRGAERTGPATQRAYLQA